ncbi:MAG: EAL domain-containing protein (putative c-di-GMP-specific phosphodiesterase class I) [Oleiphilaceae bacterium]|jgi:EAL domain-containing protein (putative c-di-GMP-specific phosphodiesterase class I)
MVTMNYMSALKRVRKSLPAVDLMAKYTPHFQPIVDIPSGRIRGYEALARERLSNGEMISCGRYFADETIDKNFLLALDRRVRRLAIQAVSNMPDDTFLTLNISPEWIDLLSLQGSSPTIEMLREYKVDPRRVIIEITETAGNLEAIQYLVKQYRAEGMRIAIDDFGAGYSELGRLVALDPDILKIDMRFFKSAVAGGIAHDAVKAIGFMAERIGCDIICEGVENEREFNFAVDCGATLIQGFLFYEAMPDFTPPDASKALVSKLLTGFREHKIDLEKHSIEHYRAIFQHACHVRDMWLSQAGPGPLPQVPEGFIRFYICSYESEQLTPNYNYGQGGWRRDSSPLGMNWSGRLFLHKVLALENLVDRTEFTTGPYRDRISGKLFKTIGLKIPEDRILFVDYEVLF